MKVIGLGTSALGAAVLFALGSCGGSSSGGGKMFVETCSLGCSSGSGGGEVSCTVIAAFVDQEVDVYFSQPVDASSVSSQSMQLVDVNSGSVPNGERFVDPLNPNKVVFRPSVSFDAQGNAQFGFLANHTYRVTVPGKTQGDTGPFIRSSGGGENQSRLKCDISTSLGLIDLVPGAPSLTHVYVQQAITSTPDVNDFIPNVDCLGGPPVVDVWRNSTIVLVFGDLMNPVTLANPLTQLPTFLSITVDTDGNLLTTNDRAPLNGLYVVHLDPVLLQTTVEFTATNGMPSSGDPMFDPLPRKVVVTVPSSVQDLVGNGLSNPQSVSFTPEFVQHDPLILPSASGETFVNTNNENVAQSSASWGGGKLIYGFGGGSGRLGELHVPAGQTVTLNTDSQTFPIAIQIRDLLDNAQPTTPTASGDYNPADTTTWPTITVTDGIFEFTSIFIESNGTLVLTGTHSARLFSRGPANIQGLIDAGGITPAVHQSNALAGGLPGAGGPNGGDGGRGASRANYDPAAPGSAALIAIGAVHITDPTVVITNDGLHGMGVGRSATTAAGNGGVRFPHDFPTSRSTNPPDIGGVALTSNPSSFTCQVLQVASPGSGGGYATDGVVAHPATQITTNIVGGSNLPTLIAAGGLSSQVGIEPPDPESGHIVRTLNAYAGFLRGGSGGGGAGQHLYDTTTDDLFGSTCQGGVIQFDNFTDQSAASGGGGGGAIQLTCGSNMAFSGVLDATGGDGGSSFTVAAGFDPRPARAMPGGGGSGGAVHLQAKVLQLTQANPPRVRVDGGAAGTSANLQEDQTHAAVFATGGRGGAGLIRLEDLTTDPLNPLLPGLKRHDEAPLVSPTDTTIVGTDARNILSAGFWLQPRKRPESYSAGMSCWMKPTGNFFQVVFVEDSGVGTPGVSYGWNMDIVYNSGSGDQIIPYRGNTAQTPQFPNGGTDFETGLGNILNYGLLDLDGSYFAVRFQGALLSGTLTDPCNVSLSGPNAQIASGSLTTWVRHPGELNLFAPRPNMVRFCIVFDYSLYRTHGLTGFIKGVTNLKIKARPD